MRFCGAAAVVGSGLFAFTALWGCGGKVVFDTDSSAGGSTSTSTPLDGSSSGSSCSDLDAALKKSIAKARSCNPAESSNPCDGSANVIDACDCSIVLNEELPQAVDAAHSASQAYFAAGCSKPACSQECPPVGSYACLSVNGAAACSPFAI